MNKKWLQSDTDYLINNYHLYDAREIAKVLDKPLSTVFTHASQLKLVNKNKIIISLEDVVDYFKEFNVEVLSEEYINSNQKLKLKCFCGEIFERTFSKAKSNSPICSDCNALKRHNDALQPKLESIVNSGITILEIHDPNKMSTDISFICNCGKIDRKSLKYLYKNPMCNTCSSNKKGYRINLTNDEVAEIIETKSECKLISTDYENRTSKLTLLCKCGKQFYTYIDRFLVDKKRQCNDCGILRRSGEGNPMWKGGITPETQKLRHSKEYINWRKSVFERDNYTCQCCGDSKGGNLQAHHILSFSEHEDLRLDVSNGITICSIHHDFRYHDSFHHMYGTRNNTLEQLQEYFDMKRTELNLPLIDIKEIIYKPINKELQPN